MDNVIRYFPCSVVSCHDAFQAILLRLLAELGKLGVERLELGAPAVLRRERRLAARTRERPLGGLFLSKRLPRGNVSPPAELLKRELPVVAALGPREVVELRLAVLVAAGAEGRTEGIGVVREQAAARTRDMVNEHIIYIYVT